LTRRFGPRSRRDIATILERVICALSLWERAGVRARLGRSG
jgi:hypothetical protein